MISKLLQSPKNEWTAKELYLKLQSPVKKKEEPSIMHALQ